jgi:hypothetical protein
MRISVRYLWAAVAGLLLAAPSFGGKVRVESPPGVDLSQYKTYSWLPVKALTHQGIVENEPNVTPIVKESINLELSQKGLKEVPSGGDLQVAVVMLNRSIPQLEAVVFAGPDLMFDTPIATMGRYNKEGTMVVNLIDPKTKKSAWTGMATESVDNKAGGGLKKIPGAAEKMFKKFPPLK